MVPAPGAGLCAFVHHFGGGARCCLQGPAAWRLSLVGFEARHPRVRAAYAHTPVCPRARCPAVVHSFTTRVCSAPHSSAVRHGACSFFSCTRFFLSICTFQMLHRTERGPIVAFGCEDGSVLLSVNHVERQRAQLDGPVSCVALFSSGVARVGRSARQELWADRPPLVHWKVAADSRDTDWGSVSQRVQRGTQAASAALSALRANVAAAASAAPSATKEVCLCVGGAVGFGAVFDDVDTNGLDVCCTLPSSHEHDSVLSAATGDFLALGSTQVVLGTYGGSILVYSRAQQRPTDWELTFVLSFGPPVSALAVLRQIDVVPHLLVSSSSTFAVVAMRVSDLERLLQSRLEDAAKKYFEAETK